MALVLKKLTSQEKGEKKMIRCVSLVAGYVESASPKPFIIFYNGSAVFETKNEALDPWQKLFI
jgi:endo-alpha-1,4-polygalactosaminidase (GH114 family)